MEYVGTGLQVVLPDTGQVTDLTKGDVVGYEQFGGKAFFAGRTDFVEQKPAKAAASGKKGKSSG